MPVLDASRTLISAAAHRTMATEGKHLVLRYLDCQGRGEPIRLLLVDALGDPVGDAAARRGGGMAWVDEHVVLATERKMWPAAKNDPDVSGVHGTLPVLEWDGCVINQTLACASAAAAAVGRSGDGAHAMVRGLSVAQLCYEVNASPFLDAHQLLQPRSCLPSAESIVTVQVS